MGYHSSVGNTTAAVTTDNTTAIAISCPTIVPVQWQTADLTVTTASSPGAGTVASVYDVSSPGGNDTTYVAKVVLEPSYQVWLLPLKPCYGFFCWSVMQAGKVTYERVPVAACLVWRHRVTLMSHSFELLVGCMSFSGWVKLSFLC